MLIKTVNKYRSHYALISKINIIVKIIFCDYLICENRKLKEFLQEKKIVQNIYFRNIFKNYQNQ